MRALTAGALAAIKSLNRLLRSTFAYGSLQHLSGEDEINVARRPNDWKAAVRQTLKNMMNA